MYISAGLILMLSNKDLFLEPPARLVVFFNQKNAAVPNEPLQ